MNINGTIDPFYRYKMEPINLISTRKNGGTAIVKNTVAICTSLARDPKHVARYISKVIGRSVKLQDNCLVINGDTRTEELQNILQDYINKFVLCKVCGNPETKLSKDDLRMKCASCGKASLL